MTEGGVVSNNKGLSLPGVDVSVPWKGGLRREATGSSFAAPRAAGSGVDWSRVDVFWGDERYVAADSADGQGPVSIPGVVMRGVMVV